MKGVCRECGIGFRGRTDKIFCSDPCRNAYHNRRNRVENNLLRRVNNRLRRNYRILQESLGGLQGRVIPRPELAEKGFDFSSVTGLAGTRDGLPCYQLYDLYIVSHQGNYQVFRENARKTQEMRPGLFPVLGVELKRGHHDILPADLANEQPILHDG